MDISLQEWAEKFVGNEVHMMTSYLLLMTFWTNGVKEQQHQWKKCVDRKGDDVEK